MTVPPDITIILAFTAVFIAAAYFIDRHIQKKKKRDETIHL